MKYNLSALKIDSYVKTNLIKMLQLHDLVDEVIVFNPNLFGKLSSTWQDAYKLLGMQAVPPSVSDSQPKAPGYPYYFN